MKTFASLLGVTTLGLVLTNQNVFADDPVIVHEWGTFTCLQDENGQAVGGINVDDEPVPGFVQNVGDIPVAAQYSGDDEGFGVFGLPPYAIFASKAGPMPICDPAVTMRLETPVIYMYPPKGSESQSVPPLDVHVDFLGGVLGQFYPHASFSGLPTRHFQGAPQLEGKYFYMDGPLAEKTTTTLDWKGVTFWSTEKPRETRDKVWTTPREVSAPLLQVKFSEVDNNNVLQHLTQAENFLFYRGVGHLNSPLALARYSYNAGDKSDLQIWSAGAGDVAKQQLKSVEQANEIADTAFYSAGWLAEIHADGTCAFRSISKFGGLRTQSRMSPMTEISSSFGAADFSAGNLSQLKASMHVALVKEGLYDDEATAMLKTWELSYFKSPGLRFFYIVPRAWTDKVLPLKITGAPTEITRVMVGRIELVTDAQKAALARLSAGPCPNLAAVKQAGWAALQNNKLPRDQVAAFYTGEKPISELGITVPPLVQDYLSLGRFRDALIVHEQKVHPSQSLALFIKDNQLVAQGN